MNTRQTHSLTRSTLIAAAVATALLSSAARAGCAGSPEGGAPTSAPSLQPAVWRSDSPTFQLIHDSDEQGGIVGLWRFEMLTKSTKANTNPMPDGTLDDFGYATWHGDGTEIMNSGIHNPADSNFCMGVWKQVGRSTYRLSHHPLPWAGGSYLGPIDLEMQVTLSDDGNSYSGQYVERVFAAAALPGHEFDENVPLATITGTIKATRVTVQ